MSETIKNLYNLEDLTDYEIAKNYSDIRGWDVKDANNRTIGKVDHLLVNKAEKRVVYLDVEVDESIIDAGFDTYQTPVSEGVHEFLNREGENHLIIPIGMSSIDENHKLVTTQEIDSSTFAKAKRFSKGDVIDFVYELDIIRHYRGDNTIHSKNNVDGFYDRDEFKHTFYKRASE